jgi:hypothetical protein
MCVAWLQDVAILQLRIWESDRRRSRMKEPVGPLLPPDAIGDPALPREAVVHTVEDSEGTHSALLSDRRRANRKDYQNPHLIALMRGQRASHATDMEAEATQAAEATPDLETEPTSDSDQGALTSARGVAFGLLFGIALWALIALAWYLL